ncbi:MAG: hypothetical protein RDV48_12080 [Candidatus Eremiobacteraeota bacterium]|nr:hypothetical protein [Candidatus Eremiobacteraeota bacterium]
MAEDGEKGLTEGIQAIIKANKEGFSEYMQSVQQASASRFAQNMQRQQAFLTAGSSSNDSSSFSREASGMMG